MNIAVFGATGDTGRRFCRRALDNGHQITPFSYRRTVIEGVEEVRSTPIELNDDSAVYHALEGVDAIVSAIGGEQSTRASGIESLVIEFMVFWHARNCKCVRWYFNMYQMHYVLVLCWWLVCV